MDFPLFVNFIEERFNTLERDIKHYNSNNGVFGTKIVVDKSTNKLQNNKMNEDEIAEAKK